MKPQLNMLLLIISISFMTLFSGCSKNDTRDLYPEMYTDVGALAAKPIVVTETYQGSYYDDCRNEDMILTGIITYKLTEVRDPYYYIKYDIDFKGIATGVITGQVFKGGNRYTGEARQSEDGLDVKASVKFKFKFVAPGGDKIYFWQHSRYRTVNGVIKVDFNNISAGCS